jgi:hypothetical protein
VDELEQALRAATEVAAADRVDRVPGLISALCRIAAQSDDTGGAGFSGIDVARKAATEIVGSVEAFLDMLPSAHGPGGRLLIPDTNAVIWQPDLTVWNIGAATLVIVPTVVTELDELKTRAGPVSAKAIKAIRVLNGLETRGDTFVGVKLSGAGWLREMAVDPVLPVRPTWLATDHSDDRILAAALALCLQDLNAEVALVTRDRNMRNKARLAGLSVEDVTTIASAG